jgi:hypothetical protein
MLSPSFLRRLRTLGLSILLAGIAIVLLKLVLLWGPWLLSSRQRPVAAMFPLHARALILAELGYPRALEGFLPAPPPGSGAALQLGGMGLWDGRAWTSKALALGSVEGRGLRVRMGSLVLAGMGDISPCKASSSGSGLCTAFFRVRWDVGSDLKELVRTRLITGLSLPDRLGLSAPGGEEQVSLTFERKPLGWRLQNADGWRRQLPGRASGRWVWLSSLL